MPTSISLGSTALAVGTRQFLINGLPPTSTGFQFILGRDNTWPAGTIADITVEIAPDGVNFTQWIAVSILGGTILDKFGQPLTQFFMEGKWPGQNDGSGGRQIMRQTDVRFTANILQAFTATSVDFHFIST